MTFCTARKLYEGDIQIQTKKALEFAERHDLELNGESPAPFELDCAIYQLEMDRYERPYGRKLRKLWTNIMARAWNVQPGINLTTMSGYIGYDVED